MVEHRKDEYLQFLREFEELKVRVRHLFEDKITAVFSGGPTSTGEWTPAVDVCEMEDRITLVAEVAGVSQEDIHVEVVDNVLTVRGVRPFARKDVTSENYHRMEFSYGSFERSFTLPFAVEESGIEAVLKDGVLTVTLPRSRRETERTIGVKKG